MSAVVAYVVLHSRQSSRSRPDASPGRYSSGRPHRGQSGSRSSRIRSATWSSRGRRPPVRRRFGTRPEQDVGLVEEGDIGLAPSVPAVLRGLQRVQLVGREDVAPGALQAPGRREQTAQEPVGGEHGPDGVEGLGQSTAVDHVEERRRVHGPLPGRCGRAAGRARGGPGTRLPAPGGGGAPPAAGRRCACSIVASPWRRWPRGRRARPRGGTDPPTARCPPAVPAGGPGSPGRGRRPCGDRP